jgi:hypothetical protein
MPILLMLQQPPLRALCHSVEKNTDSLVKGMILFAQGGGGGGGKRSWSKAFPLVSPWSACFLMLFARSIFSDIIIIFAGSKLLTGNSPAGPPNVALFHSLLANDSTPQSRGWGTMAAVV